MRDWEWCWQWQRMEASLAAESLRIWERKNRPVIARHPGKRCHRALAEVAFVGGLLVLLQLVILLLIMSYSWGPFAVSAVILRCFALGVCYRVSTIAIAVETGMAYRPRTPLRPHYAPPPEVGLHWVLSLDHSHQEFA